MAQQIELTAEQLSALDQVIVEKEAASPDFVKLKNVIKDVARACPVVAVVAQAVAGKHNADEMAVMSPVDVVKNASLDELIELRKNAIQKK